MQHIEKALEIMACPECKGPLAYINDPPYLRCNSCNISWPVIDGIPRFVDVNCVEAASPIDVNLPDDEQSEEMLARAKAHWEDSPNYQYEATSQLYSRQYYEEQDKWRENEVDPFCMHEYRFESIRGQVILDIGCGSGWVVKQCARNGAFAVGVDFTEKAAHSTQKALETYGYAGLAIQADAQKLPIKNEIIDRIYSIGVLHHIPSTEKGIAEAYRVTKREGTGFISLYGKLFFFNPVLFPIAQVALRSLLKAPKVRDGIQQASTYDDFYRLMDGPKNPIGRWYLNENLYQLMKPFEVQSINNSHFPLRYLKIGNKSLSHIVPRWFHRILENNFGMMRNMQLIKH